MYNTALAIVQNPEDAEDVTQELFVQLYESIHSFKGESKLTTWLYRITVSKAMDHLRKKKRKKRFAFVQSLFGANEELVHDPPDFTHPGVSLDNKEKAKELFNEALKKYEAFKPATELDPTWGNTTVNYFLSQYK